MAGNHSRLDLNKVCKSFKKLMALVDQDMAVAQGKIVELIDPNGAGKYE